MQPQKIQRSILLSVKYIVIVFHEKMAMKESLVDASYMYAGTI